MYKYVNAKVCLGTEEIIASLQLYIVVLVTLPALMMNQSTVISPHKGDNLCLPTFVALFS